MIMHNDDMITFLIIFFNIWDVTARSGPTATACSRVDCGAQTERLGTTPCTLFKADQNPLTNSMKAQPSP